MPVGLSNGFYHSERWQGCFQDAVQIVNGWMKQLEGRRFELGVREILRNILVRPCKFIG